MKEEGGRKRRERTRGGTGRDGMRGGRGWGWGGGVEELGGRYIGRSDNGIMVPGWFRERVSISEVSEGSIRCVARRNSPDKKLVAVSQNWSAGVTGPPALRVGSG